MGLGRGGLLWLLGVPLPIIVLLVLFWHHLSYGRSGLTTPANVQSVSRFPIGMKSRYQLRALSDGGDAHDRTRTSVAGLVLPQAWTTAPW
jgi:hypothetical protein